MSCVPYVFGKVNMGSSVRPRIFGLMTVGGVTFSIGCLMWCCTLQRSGVKTEWFVLWHLELKSNIVSLCVSVVGRVIFLFCSVM